MATSKRNVELSIAEISAIQFALASRVEWYCGTFTRSDMRRYKAIRSDYKATRQALRALGASHLLEGKYLKDFVL